jgi:hypothetical protein
MGASSCATAFPDGVSRDVLPEPELAGAHHDASGGGCTARGTGLVGRSPRWAPSWWSGLGLAGERARAGRRSCTCHARASCKARDAVTVPLAAALRATTLHDGAGARAVAT